MMFSTLVGWYVWPGASVGTPRVSEVLDQRSINNSPVSPKEFSMPADIEPSLTGPQAILELSFA
jgi:hypothetical protein